MCLLTEKEKSRQLLAEASAYPKLRPVKGISKNLSVEKSKHLKLSSLTFKRSSSYGN